MEMLRHNDKSMQQEATLVPVSEDRIHQKFRVRGSEKQGSSLKRDGSYGVGVDGAPPILVCWKDTPDGDEAKDVF
jgi:hypothetical protein